MTLFDDRRQAILNRQAPLATRMRPRTLDEFVGQHKLVGPERVVRRMIEHDRLHSMILWGPPGSGKTTLAQLISHVTSSHFVELSAVTSGVRDIRREAEEAQHRVGSTGMRTILFVDEIHRFSKSQQDALLPHVEAGTFILIGATTENPSFEVIAPLLSRTRVYTMDPLEDADMNRIIDAALNDLERGLASTNPLLNDDARSFLLRSANGDARSVLNALEIAVEAAPLENGHRTIYRRTRRASHRETSTLRPTRRHALRHHIRIHQECPSLRPRRRDLLPRPHDRCRRRSAFHRSQTGHPRG